MAALDVKALRDLADGFHKKEECDKLALELLKENSAMRVVNSEVRSPAGIVTTAYSILIEFRQNQPKNCNVTYLSDVLKEIGRVDLGDALQKKPEAEATCTGELKMLESKGWLYWLSD